MRLRRHHWAAIALSCGSAIALFFGCNAGLGNSGGSGGGVGGEVTSTGTILGTGSNATGTGGSVPTSSTTFMGMGGMQAVDVPKNPCGTECGPKEICDGIHKGLDDNCDGVVDEGCPCSPGEAESCFLGDPSYLNTPGCFPGTQLCTELGNWGPCIGGSHATEGCFNAQDGCHPISAVPFATVDLSTGLGNFGNGGTNPMYELSCPMDASPCPMPDANGDVQVLVSGEYTVTYTQTLNGDTSTCTYPLYVGARGLRVELSWDFPTGDSADLDLHLHEPGTITPWKTDFDAEPQDCGFDNCKIQDYDDADPFADPSISPHWFPDTQATPTSPVNWFLDPVATNNLCYNAPRNAGDDWVQANKGCHNPRLDIDNVTCDPSITNSHDDSFCVPENINVDFPPTNVWMRIGVEYFSASSTNTIHPNVRIYCDGKIAADLGAHGFYNPETAVAWGKDKDEYFWPVADVMVQQDQCSKTCVVKPIYLDATSRQPIFVPNHGESFGPAYPPAPTP